jgi:hypothetical protein
MSHSAQPLRRVLEGGSPALVALAKELRHQQRLLAHIKSILPAPVASRCIGARVAGSTLTLFADSAGWATRLRFHGPEIVTLIRQTSSIHVERIQLKIIADVETAHQQGNTKRVLSARAAASLRTAADEIGDTRLKEALYRLAIHGT